MMIHRFCFLPWEHDDCRCKKPGFNSSRFNSSHLTVASNKLNAVIQDEQPLAGFA
jgi:hypothetical protein